MKSKRTINVDDLLQTESELLRRIAGEVVKETGSDIGNVNPSVACHRSGGHGSHVSAMREKVAIKEEKK